MIIKFPLHVSDGDFLYRGTIRTDMPWVELEEDLEFVQFIKNYNIHNKPKVMALLEKYHHKDIFIFKSRGEAGEFLKYIQ